MSLKPPVGLDCCSIVVTAVAAAQPGLAAAVDWVAAEPPLPLEAGV